MPRRLTATWWRPRFSSRQLTSWKVSACLSPAGFAWSALGNIGARVVRRDGARALVPGLGYAGSGRTSKIVRETGTLGAGEAVVLFTDGISGSAGWQVPPDLSTAHPAFLAHHILVTHGRDHDDQTIVVAR